MPRIVRFRLSPAVFLLLCAFTPDLYAEDGGLPLKLDQSLPVTVRSDGDTPVFLSADKVEGNKDSEVDAIGNVELRKRGQAIFADRMTYDSVSRDVTAEGSVRLEQDNSVILSPSLQYNLDTNTGAIPQPTFTLGTGNSQSRGSADSAAVQGKGDYLLHQVSYTTCPVGDDDWMLKMESLNINRNTQVGEAVNARIEFMGVPILYSPWMSFSLDGRRKSGMLSPIFGNTVQGGTELTLPFYWNIAPDMDATIAPRILTRRGVQLNNEFRYLEPGYSGEVHLDVLPDDSLTGTTRSRLSVNHVQDFGGNISGLVNFNRVSDDNYFRDLSDTIVGTSQTNLIRQGMLSYAGDWWQASAQLLSFQTLQDPAAPVVIPYDSLPQLSFTAERTVDNADVSFAA
ncbi:MAG: LPS assembly protein LptD, partial [Gallionellaceae bacterium]|nr:LPS assembly protein LptD [Gallionellaceae bacterium]